MRGCPTPAPGSAWTSATTWSAAASRCAPSGTTDRSSRTCTSRTSIRPCWRGCDPRELDGFGTAVRERIFTELGNGALDLHGVLATLEAVDFDGWLMVEQDSSWLRPAEAAAVGLRVLRYALRELER